MSEEEQQPLLQGKPKVTGYAATMEPNPQQQSTPSKPNAPRDQAVTPATQTPLHSTFQEQAHRSTEEKLVTLP